MGVYLSINLSGATSVSYLLTTEASSDARTHPSQARTLTRKNEKSLSPFGLVGPSFSPPQSTVHHERIKCVFYSFISSYRDASCVAGRGKLATLDEFTAAIHWTNSPQQTERDAGTPKTGFGPGVCRGDE